MLAQPALSPAAPAPLPDAPARRQAAFQMIAASLVALQDGTLWPLGWAAAAAGLTGLAGAVRMENALPGRLLAGVMLGAASATGSDWGVLGALMAVTLCPRATPALTGATILPALFACAALPTPERAGTVLLALLGSLFAPPAPAALAPQAEAAPPRPALPDVNRILGRDQTTGLPNRLGLHHLLADETARATTAGTPLSLLVIRLDTAPAQSRHATRPVMAAVAETMHATLQRPFDRLAWLGPNRFAAVLPFTDALGADRVARRMAEALAPAAPGEHLVSRCPRATLSIGIATYGGRGALPETVLMQQAEQAEAMSVSGGGARISRYDPMAATLRPKSFAERDPEAARRLAAPVPEALAS